MSSPISRRALVATSILLVVVAATACGTAASDTGAAASPPSSIPAATANGTGTSGSVPSSTGDPALSPGTHRITLTVDGMKRTATVAVPEDSSQPAPLVFAFHGHGGSGENF